MSNESRITFALVSLNGRFANTINSHDLPMISIAFVSFSTAVRAVLRWCYSTGSGVVYHDPD
jgi:hypothetical protein